MNETSNPPSTDAREPEFEMLARETDTPLDMVREIYRTERDKLERSARIKTYVPVLAHRRVKALLQVERGKRYLTAGHIGQPENL
jgi:Protein of unknown function (DUF3562)